MKIVHLLWSLGIGGVETMLVDIAIEQAKSEDVYLFIVNNVIDLNLYHKLDGNVKVYCANRTPGSKSVWPIVKLNYKLKRLHPDILHFHLDDQTKIVFGTYNKVRTIHNMHSSSDDFKKFLKLFCISKAVKERTAMQGYSNAVVVYNGIHTELINHNSRARAKDAEQKRFVCVGRLYEDKGQRLIVEAVNELVNKRHVSGFTIDLIGDGPMRKSLELDIQQYGLNEYIHLSGIKPRDWVYPRLCEYDLFILPSISEGFGLTLAEAMAAKVPVITSNLAGPLEVIDGGRLGRYFDTGNSTSLADQIEKFLSYGRNTSQIEEAYQYVKENFDVTETARHYLNEYKSLLYDSK